MGHKSLFAALFLCLSQLLTSCSKDSVASLDLRSGSSDPNAQSCVARARINFTEFTQPPGASGNDTNLRLKFSNAEGDSMVFVLGAKSGGFGTGEYKLDGSTNTFEATYTITSNSVPETCSATTTNGKLTLTSLSLPSGVVSSISGSFQLNLQIGGLAAGAAAGTINVTSAGN